MKITVNKENRIQIEEVFNDILLKTKSGEKLYICMRDGGFEIQYQDNKYSAQDGVISQITMNKTNNSKGLKEELNAPFNPDDFLGAFNKTTDEKATKALQFYEDYKDKIATEKTIDNEGFDWDECRAFCGVGKNYSHSRFKNYVSRWFGVSVKDMNSQWRNINYEN